MQRSKAFTLIELLVVIAIIAILAAILFPVFAQAKLAAKKTVAISNAKQVALGLNLYATDFDDMIMPSYTYNTPGINGSTNTNAPFDCLMQPYVKSYEFWHTPGDSHTLEGGGQTDDNLWDGSLAKRPVILRSFGYIGHMATDQDGGYMDRNTGIGPIGWDVPTYPVRSMTQFSEPSNTLAFAEIWPPTGSRVGVRDGSTLINCDNWKFAGRVPGVDQLPDGAAEGRGCNGQGYRDAKPTAGYGGYAAYARVDGSAKALKWAQIRQNDMYMFKVNKPNTVVTP